ncbi:MAG TPA: hypothetical protein VNA19_13415 [Pyrinomonadaceae bacterium]|jgi:hypothetical protein|nr:hypothetical protein [Pyrinomonadaceae bacterium]
MAYKETTDDPGFPYFYNVHMSVGRGCPNMVEDVLLVQYLLYKIYQNPGSLPVPRGQMVVDGICGPVTLNWILSFQKHTRALGRPIFPDGRVDPGQEIVGKHNHQFTIIELNGSFKKREPFLFANLASAPDAPPRLTAVLA